MDRNKDPLILAHFRNNVFAFRVPAQIGAFLDEPEMLYILIGKCSAAGSNNGIIACTRSLEKLNVFKPKGTISIVM